MTANTPSADALPVLTIAGSDPSGGAGMQADLKTFAACGVYGMAALTVATDCNTAEGVTQVEALPPAFVRRQIDRVCADIPPRAVKTGMLFSQEIIRVVAEAAARHAFTHFVVDPVITTRRGERLLSDGAEAALVEALLPRAAVTTPSLPEAARLADFPVETRADMARAAEAIHALGAAAVVVTGGHLADDRAADCFFDGRDTVWLEAERVPQQMHGAGDSFSAALAAGLAQDLALPAAVRRAKAFVTGAVQHAPGLGRGNGPLGHAWSGRAHAAEEVETGEVGADGAG